MSSVGKILQEARKKKEISQEVAAKNIKLRVERLRDLEEDRYDQFPAYVYVRSFLRHYADYLEIDSAALLQKFAEENPAPSFKPIFDTAEKQGSHSPVQRHVPSQSLFLTTTGKIVLLGVFFVLIAAFAVVWWMVYKQPRFSESNLSLGSLKTEISPSNTSSPNSWEETLPTAPIYTPSLALGTNRPPSEIHHAP